MEFHLKFLAIFPFGQTAFCFVAAAFEEGRGGVEGAEEGAISSVVATRREVSRGRRGENR